MLFGMISYKEYLKLGIQHRTIGNEQEPFTIASGFLSKNGMTIDFQDYIHTRHAFIYVIQGEGKYIEDNGTEHLLQSGSWFNRLPGVLHTNTIEPNSNWIECFIDFPAIISQSLDLMGCYGPNQLVGINKSAISHINEFADITRTLKWKSDSDCRKAVPSMMQLVIRIMEQHNQTETENQDIAEKQILHACDHFRKHVTSRFTIQEYCKKEGIGYEKFRKDFVKFTGLSPSKFNQRRRLDESLTLLSQRNPHLTNGEISDQLGYNSQFEFTTQFKQQYKVSPYQYRVQTHNT